ncbi:hypothetical protein HAX54_031253 [Datura stramonium]|uniref:Uncharacterized protein n=1 Tax=Datura stramonium TaxID=4076 RepID=A0ABS8VCG3_DATST|nr:hypothetical protein [Datura stramonium]
MQVVNMQRETYRHDDYYPEYEEEADFADTGYGGRDQGNWGNRGPPLNDSRDGKIKAILSQLLIKLESTELGVNKMRSEDDRCIAVEPRSGRTTLEQQTLGTRFDAEENNPSPARE